MRLDGEEMEGWEAEEWEEEGDVLISELPDVPSCTGVAAEVPRPGLHGSLDRSSFSAL